MYKRLGVNLVNMLKEKVHNTKQSLRLITVRVDDIISWGKEQLTPGALLCVPFSGGIDSATCLALAVRAVGPERVVALHVGHTSLEPEETENANRVADLLDVQLIKIDLTQIGLLYRNIIGESIKQVAGNSKPGTETIQNSSLVYLAAREVARQSGAMIVGTLDLAECLVGYFPKGAFCGDFLWIAGLLRAEVRQLAADLGLPILPEAPLVTSVCGSIATYINEVGKQEIVQNEKDLDMKLLELFLRRQINRDLLEDLCLSVRHKARSTLLGRPVYYPSPGREAQVLNWLEDNQGQKIFDAENKKS